MLLKRLVRVTPMAVLLGGLATSGSSALAQPVVAPPPGQPDGETGADVFLDESLEAVDAITEGGRLSARGDWVGAALLLQQTSDAYGDKLIELSPGYYVGLRSHLNRLIATWPEPGIAAYRDLFETRLEREVQRLPAPAPLEASLQLFERYFATAGAAELAHRVGQRAIESGDFDLAERVYGLILELHPDRESYQVPYGSMLALIGAMRGEETEAETEPGPARPLSWMGNDRPLRSVLEQVRTTFEHLDEVSVPDDWPIFGGAPTRGRTTPTRIDQLGQLWRFDAFTPPASNRGRRGRSEIVGGTAAGSAFTIHPVVSGDLVFVQRYREIVALDRKTGIKRWSFLDSESGPANPGRTRPTSQSVTVYEGRLYASLSAPIPLYYNDRPAGDSTQLISLDAATGREYWRIKRSDLGADAHEISFDSSPVVQGQRLYIVGRRRRTFGFEDCYLFGIRTLDGAILFRTHLGGASTATMGSRRSTQAVPAIQRGRVYLCSNLGTVACVSGYSGSVQWLRRYDRDRLARNRNPRIFPRRGESGLANPVILDADRVAVMPSDALRALVLAADDGRLLSEVPARSLRDAQIMLGLRDNVLCTAGLQVACHDLAAGQPLWTKLLPRQSFAAGRGVWAGDRILIPTNQGLSGYAIADGRRSDAPWSTGGTGGNLVALPDHLLVAGGSSLSYYVRRADIWTALKDRMEADPNNPVPALDFAQTALEHGEMTEALTWLDEAIRRAGDFAEPLDIQFQQRLYHLILPGPGGRASTNFLDAMAAKGNRSFSPLDRLFACAAQTSFNTKTDVEYRMKFAGEFERLATPNRAIRLYQQILRDRSLREVVSAIPPNATETAASRAENRIAALIRAYGPAVYDPYESEARQLLDSARTSGNEASLTRIVETFPNSKTAPVAMVTRGDWMVQSGEYLSAAKVYTRAYHRYRNQVNRLVVLRKIADSYERGGRREHAYRWLTKAAREFPAATINFEARMVTLIEYRERLADVRHLVEPSRPRLTLPLSNHATIRVEKSGRLLVPRFRRAPSASWDTAYLHDAGSIRAFEPGLETARWVTRLESLRVPELLVMTSEVAVFADKYKVFALDAATGEKRWSHGPLPADPENPDRDWEGAPEFRRHAYYRGKLVSVRTDQRITCVDVSDGSTSWELVDAPLPIGPLHLSETWFAYHVFREDRAILHLVDAETGEAAEPIQTSEEDAIESMFVSLNDQVVLVTTRSVRAYDIESGKQNWRYMYGGRIRKASIAPDVDALYFSRADRTVEKISLTSGSRLWVSERLDRRDGLTLDLQDNSVIVSSVGSVRALDPVTGNTLWTGSSPREANFRTRFITESFAVAVHVSSVVGTESTAYFYDHRNASGVLQEALKLGKLENIRAILLLDGALLIQTGQSVQSWTSR